MMRPRHPLDDDDNNAEHPDNGGHPVMDISEAWLAAKEDERLFPPGIWQKASDTQKRAAKQVKSLLRFVMSKPTNQSVQRRADDIFETVQFATGIPSLIPPVLAMLETLILPLEQLGEWARLEPWFMQMFPLLVEKAPKDIHRWQRMLIEHSRYTGLRTRLNGTINDLLEAKVLEPNEHRLMILLRTTTTNEEFEQISDELLKIAEGTQDHRLTMQVYSYKARRHLENYQPVPAFANAQQAFCLAALLQDGHQLANTASYMAMVFHQHMSQPHKAMPYLELAMLHAEAAHNHQQLIHVRITHAFCNHALQHHQAAATELQAVLPYLDSSGIFYARALYVWCAAMSNLDPTPEQFAEIETNLRKVIVIFEHQQSDADILNAHMALIQIYLDQNNLRQARLHYLKSLEPLLKDQLDTLSDVHKHYVKTLLKKLGKLGLLV